jgi:hypothetical protein
MIHPPLVTGNEWHGLGLQHTSPLPAQQGYFLLLNERSPTEALLFYKYLDTREAVEQTLPQAGYVSRLIVGRRFRSGRL